MDKDISLRPLAGTLDNRTEPELVPSERWMKRLNCSPSSVGTAPCRRPGWRKFLHKDAQYNNEDLHDQLLPLQMYYSELTPAADGSKDVFDFPNDKCGQTLQTRSNGREPILFGKEIVTTEGGRYAIVGTQSRLYLLNESTGNWQILADGMGGPFRTDNSVRWESAQVLNTVILTNNYDRPVSYEIGNKISGCAMQSVKQVEDLDTIKLTKAGTVIAFKGMVIFGNVVMDNGRFENRLVWSDFNDATSYDPAKQDSITGFQDLSYGHHILKMEVLGDLLYIYTTRGIWRAVATGSSDAPLAFSGMYEAKDGHACLFYPNTLVSTGSEHYYAAFDGIYRIDPYITEPERTDWVHFGSGEMYSEINSACCAGHVAGFNSETLEIHMSYAVGDDCTPSKTFVFCPKHSFSSYMDDGFTCFFTYHSDRRISFRDLLRDLCVCTAEDNPDEFLKEGLPIVRNPECPDNIPTVVYSEDLITIDGLETEDWWADAASENSLCAALGGKTADDYCIECNTSPIFVAAHATDYCLKQIGGAYSRERCANARAGFGSLDGFAYRSFTGFYFYEGYDSLLRSAPLPFGDPSQKTVISKLTVNAQALESATPAIISVRLGRSFSPLNPNNGDNCGVIWTKPLNRYFACMQAKTASEYIDRKLTPNFGINYPFYVVGNYIYLEIKITGLTDQNNPNSNTLPATGGGGCFSSCTFRAHKQ